jgi:tRNA threonylcarbamoyladenosine biosynthesis protein TsaB
MNLLAIDSSSQNLSLSIIWQGEILADFNRQMKLGASKIIFYIDKYLKKPPFDLKKIDAFVIGSGPGSFTGLRISFSIIKGFCIALSKPAISIGSFFSLAYPFRNKENKIAVISDARRNFIYAASFAAHKGQLKLKERERLTTLENFIKHRQDYLFLTSDENIRLKASALFPGLNFYPHSIYPKAKYLLEIAKSCYAKKNFTPIDKLEPLYLHPKTCQIISQTTEDR